MLGHVARATLGVGWSAGRQLQLFLLRPLYLRGVALIGRFWEFEVRREQHSALVLSCLDNGIARGLQIVHVRGSGMTGPVDSIQRATLGNREYSKVRWMA